MMRLVDASAWVEWLVGSQAGSEVAGRLPDDAERLVPTIVQLELAGWWSRERGEEYADQVVAFTQLCCVVPLGTTIALAAAEARRAHGLATADAIIFATARAHAAALLTCDGHFEGLPGVTLIPN